MSRLDAPMSADERDRSAIACWAWSGLSVAALAVGWSVIASLALALATLIRWALAVDAAGREGQAR